MPKFKEKFYAGVMGYPVSHSWSPRIFSHLSRILDHPFDYRLIEVEPKNLEKSIQAIRAFQWVQGWNVTIPYKEELFSRVDRLSPEAQAVGAINVVHLSRDGLLWGHNTDVFGVLKTLEEQKLKICGKPSVIFGAGGAALAVGYVLGKLKASQVWMVNRTAARATLQAKRLQKLFPFTIFHSATEVPAQFEAPPALYVNSTPLGMQGFPRKSLLPKKTQGDAFAFDLVYRPANTPFLRAAQKQGLPHVGGVDMLLWQALASWEIWVGKIPQIQKVKDELKQEFVTR